MKIKKLTAFILALVIIIALPLSINAATVNTAATGDDSGSCGASGGNLKYTLSSSTGLLRVYGSGAMAVMAFMGNTSIKSVVVEEGVTTIGQEAFRGCNNLQSIKLPSTLNSINRSAFYGCSSLTSVEIPSGSIGYYAFHNCSSLSSVKLKSKVTSVGEGAFYSIKSLTSVEIEEGLQSIGSSAFYGAGVKSFKLPASVTFLASNGIRGNALESVYVYNPNMTFEDTYSLTSGSGITVVYGYTGSTAQKYVENYKMDKNLIFSEMFLPTTVKIVSNNGIQDYEKEYSSAVISTSSELSVKPVDKYVFTGFYSNSSRNSTVSLDFPYKIKNSGKTELIYSNWTSVGTVEEEAGDELAIGSSTSGFDLYGAQYREETSNWSSGLRFCTRVSKELLEEIGVRTNRSVTCGYLLCKKDSIPSGSELTVGMTTTSGKKITELAAPKKYYDGDKYFVYTAVVLNIPDSMKSTDIVARPFIKYYDANGVLRYYYFTEDGSSNCGGGYYTSYAAVESAHNAAQG